MATTVFEKPERYNVATQSADGLMSSTDKTKLDGVAAGATANTGTITGITMNGASKGTSGVVDLGTVITSHQDISGKVAGPSSATANAVAIFDGTGGKTIKDSGYTIGKSVPSDAKFTDTTYSNATQSAAGLMSSSDKTKLDGIATGATANTGTITGIKMNGSSKGTSGVVDLGTVLTSHQDISGKVSGPSSATNNAVAIFDGTGGKTIKNSGYTIGKSVPSDAVFTDHTYSCTDKNVTLAWGTKSTIATACGTDIHVTMPSNPNTNTHRPIQVNGSQILGDNTTALNLKAGSNVTITNSSGTVTIAATDTNTWRGIQNNLTSTSTTDSLSAYQGKLLNDNKQSKSWSYSEEVRSFTIPSSASEANVLLTIDTSMGYVYSFHIADFGSSRYYFNGFENSMGQIFVNGRAISIQEVSFMGVDKTSQAVMRVYYR